ncbi:hypothetical protein L1887_31506 [Cichorium endivia]|nr:hypothetical protein L1887_31506 [Cichorium endivia]
MLHFGEEDETKTAMKPLIDRLCRQSGTNGDDVKAGNVLCEIVEVIRLASQVLEIENRRWKGEQAKARSEQMEADIKVL